MSKKAQGYYYSTVLDIVAWEKKMGFKHHLSFDWTDEFRIIREGVYIEKTNVAVQCRADAIEPHPVPHYRRCQNKTRNKNGLCHIHLLVDQNLTIKYRKDEQKTNVIMESSLM